MADLLPQQTETRIDQRLDALARDLGVEIAVVTAGGIDTTPKDFASRLFAHWKIGKARIDNGLLMLVVPDQRRVEMETGYGLEPVLPDGWLSAVQNDTMVPAFQRGDYAAGIEAALASIDQRLRSSEPELRAGAPTEGRSDPDGAGTRLSPARFGRGPLLGGGVAGLGLLGGVLALLRRARRRERTCPACQVQMRLLDEVEDDAHLDAGQRTEEAIGSVDYRVYICRQCQLSRTVARKRWFSGFSRCPGCRYRALHTSSETLIHATYDLGGQVRVTEVCRHCSHRREYVRHTARLTRSTSHASSSGGSGGGSFGGGRSGGGGAGASW